MSYYTNGVPFVKQSNKGQIQVIFGPMFSGKTTELMRRLRRYQIANYRCLIVRYAKDNRYCDSSIASHDGQTLAAFSCIALNGLRAMVDNFDVIGIDEGQFFPDTVRFAESMANCSKIVIVAALDATFQRTAFGDILQLVPLAESVVKLNAVCMSCFSDASFTKRTTDEQEVEIIGGAEKYMSVCRECHNKKNVVKNSPFKLAESTADANGDCTVASVSTNGHIKNLFTNAMEQ